VLSTASEKDLPLEKMEFLDNHVRFLSLNFLIYMGEVLLQLKSGVMAV